MSEREYMHQLLKKDAVCYDLPNEEIIQQLANENEELEAALNAIWPFIEEDFPKGTGENHGTCATDKYVEAANMIEKALKPHI